MVALSVSKQRKLTYLTAGLSFFLLGVDYAVIIPTLNLYLESMNGKSYYVGICLSAMSVTSLLSAPIYGRITDIIKTTKLTVLISSLFAIGGNFMYAVSTNPLMLVGSRLVVGLAAGSTSSILGMISRGTTNEQRTSVLSQIFTGRQTGVVIGPAFNLFLKDFNFTMFGFHVGPYNSAGFFMTCLWILEALLMIFFYRDLEPVAEAAVVTKANKQPETSHADSVSKEDYCHSPRVVEKLPTNSFLTHVYNDLFTEETVFFLAGCFIILFVQDGMEALVTPLSQLLFNWGELLNSAYYSVTGVVNKNIFRVSGAGDLGSIPGACYISAAITHTLRYPGGSTRRSVYIETLLSLLHHILFQYVISLVSLSFLSKKVEDRFLILFGLASLTLNSMMFLLFVIFEIRQPSGQPTSWMLALFIINGVVSSSTITYAFVPMVSLFSKFTSVENQGFTQGIRLVFNGLGKILGPLWATSLLNNLILMSAVNFSLHFLLLVMFFASYKQIVYRQAQIERDWYNVEEHQATEKTPLLSSSDH